MNPYSQPASYQPPGTYGAPPGGPPPQNAYGAPYGQQQPQYGQQPPPGTYGQPPGGPPPPNYGMQGMASPQGNQYGQPPAMNSPPQFAQQQPSSVYPQQQYVQQPPPVYPQQPAYAPLVQYPPPQQIVYPPPQQTYVTQISPVAVYPSPVVAVQPVFSPPVAAVVARDPILYTFHLGCVNLDRKDLFSKTDPFIILSAARAPGAFASSYATGAGAGRGGQNRDWIVVHKTETIMNNQRPVFKPFTIDLMQLCNGNMDQNFLVEVWDWDRDGRHDFIGSVQTTIREMQVMKEIQLRNPHRVSLITTVAGVLDVRVCAPATTGDVVNVQPVGAVQTQQQTNLPTSYPAGGY